MGNNAPNLHLGNALRVRRGICPLNARRAPRGFFARFGVLTQYEENHCAETPKNAIIPSVPGEEVMSRPGNENNAGKTTVFPLLVSACAPVRTHYPVCAGVFQWK